MSVLGRIKQTLISVLILCLCCLVAEQMIYSIFLSGYFLRMLVSPVFWSIVSSACFWQLWVTRDKSSSKVVTEDDECDDFGFNPASGYLMVDDCFDCRGNAYGSQLFGSIYDTDDD